MAAAPQGPGFPSQSAEPSVKMGIVVLGNSYKNFAVSVLARASCSFVLFPLLPQFPLSILTLSGKICVNVEKLGITVSMFSASSLNEVFISRRIGFVR